MFAGAFLLFAPTPAARAESSADRKAELQDRFRSRDQRLDAYKKDGKIGETTEGFVEAVKKAYLDDDTLARLVKEENADRKELYAIIAKETNATPEVVAEQNARRNFQRARAGEWLKAASGEWRQKK
jgi:uncharacterized protein YdbL (DUF1318 family)